MITVNLPGGSKAQFPDGTPQDVMKAAIQKKFPPTGATPQSQAQAPAGGIALNAAVNLSNAVPTLAGAPVDLARTAINAATQSNPLAASVPMFGPILAGTQALSRMIGGVPEIPADSFGGSQSIRNAMGNVGIPTTDTVKPTNLAEQIAAGVGGAAGMTIAPEAALAGLGKLGIVGPRALEILQSIFGKSESVGSTSANAAAGGLAGGGAVAAEAVAPEPLKPLAATVGGLAGAGAGAGLGALPTGWKMVGDVFAPLSQAGRERMAGQQLYDAASSPGAVVDAIDNAPAQLVPGSQPTTFQQTGDMGLGALERGAATRDPGAFQQRRADQNAARVMAFEGMQPTGTPDSIVAALRSHLADIDAQTQQAVDAAATGAQQAAAGLGQGTAPEIAGEAARGNLEAARAAAKEQERALWSAVDPDGTLALPAHSTKRQASQIAREMPVSAKPASGEEAAIFEAVTRYGDGPVAFSELTALQSRIKAEMRAERIASGESPAYRRLTQMNGAVQNDLETAVAQKVATEQRAVAAGQMQQSDTLASWLSNSAERWNVERDSQGQLANGGTRAFGAGTGGPPPIPGQGGARGEAAGGFGRPPGNTGLPQDAGNFDQAALDRLNAARGATRTRAETFDNPTLAPIRKRAVATGPYDMPASAVPARIFFPGPKSFDAIRTYRAAVGDQQASRVLQDYAIDRLRRSALRDDGTFDPAKVANFRRAHADALRAFPALDAKMKDAATLSETLAEAVLARKEALDQEQLGILGKLLGVDDPTDMVRVIGSIFGRQDAVATMGRLRASIGRNPQALEGLRKAIAEYMAKRFVGNTEAATSGIGTMKSDQFQSFVRDNRAVLHTASFSETELGLMDAIAADLQQANRSLTAVKIPGQSNTAQDALAAKVPTSMLKILAAASASGGGAGWLAGPVVGTATTLVTGLIGILRETGIRNIDDLVKDALLDPAKARMLITKIKPESLKAAATSIGQRFRRSALAGLAEQAGGD